MKKQAILLAATAAAAIFSSSSMALPTLWTSGYGGFLDDGSISGTFPAPVFHGCADSLCSSVSWGTGQTTNGPFGTTGQSGLSINSQALDQTAPDPGRTILAPTANTINGVNVFTGNTSALQELGNLTHWNNPIDETFGPDNVNLRYVLDIYSDAGRTNQIGEAIGNFTLAVTETPNTGAGCCDDIITYTGSFGGGFTFDNVQYLISTVGFCDSRSNPETCIPANFLSPEGSNNTKFIFEAKVGTPIPTPEPGTLALIGAGLLSAAAIRRRSKAA